MPSVSVRGASPSSRRGLEGALTEAGLEISNDSPDAIVALFEDEACEGLVTAVSTGAIVVAVVSAPDARRAAHASRHGAVSIADGDADPTAIARVVTEALGGRASVPVDVLRDLAADWPDPHGPPPRISEEEIGWLTALARGVTVARLADESGYSERAMFRRLHDLYARLGVRNRSEAISEAARLGLDRTPRGLQVR